jgi:hypothetical protein
VSVGVVRHFAAVKVYTPGQSYHLNFERLVAAVELLASGTPDGRLSDALREQFPHLTPTEVYQYFCAAQACVSNNIDLEGV